MKIENIIFAPKFDKRWPSVTREIKVKARKALQLFQQNPFHPSLRLHDLNGKLQNFWSLSIDRKNRIIFEVKGDTAILHSIGSHAIYGR
jgi:mRNA-degrading endonuclease YafQ of YafQ-DinJ toxin-antitoxin module